MVMLLAQTTTLNGRNSPTSKPIRQDRRTFQVMHSICHVFASGNGARGALTRAKTYRFRLRSGGAGEEPGSIITSEHNFTDLGGVDPASSGSVIDLDWATNVSSETLLPSEGWYFTLWQSQARLTAFSRSHKDHLYWDSVRGAPDLSGTTRLWWRAFSGVPQNLCGTCGKRKTLHLNFDFFTRLSQQRQWCKRFWHAMIISRLPGCIRRWDKRSPLICQVRRRWEN